jgi:hypothetical protein
MLQTTDALSVYIILKLFHCNSGCKNAPQRYVLRTFYLSGCCSKLIEITGRIYRNNFNYKSCESLISRSKGVRNMKFCCYLSSVFTTLETTLFRSLEILDLILHIHCEFSITGGLISVDNVLMLSKFA